MTTNSRRSPGRWTCPDCRELVPLNLSRVLRAHKNPATGTPCPLTGFSVDLPAYPQYIDRLGQEDADAIMRAEFPNWSPFEESSAAQATAVNPTVAEMRRERDAARVALQLAEAAHARQVGQLERDLARERAKKVPPPVKPTRTRPPRPAAPTAWEPELTALEQQFRLDAEKARFLGDVGAKTAYESAAQRLRAARLTNRSKKG